MSEALNKPTAAEQAVTDLINNGGLDPNVMAYGLSVGRYYYNQSFGAQLRPDQVIHRLVEHAAMTQLEGGGDLTSLTMGILAGYRQAAQPAGGER